ncbi:methyl-accepting chemotaxis protein [Methylophilus rhizosphaerae]|uniref:Methyl-accepting chemotaxis protein n=1 Tax=Methylophilus rhizosphaerae TaxID=492660 RepID=A0A1G9BEM9_9PROT|nr:methyl-accepting chemotaxis protein [Methylophilus rhizosphaerae]SDK37903.1 methyl-accepting chemotaxis protein [Methylophilus rhizosphaerae]
MKKSIAHLNVGTRLFLGYALLILFTAFIFAIAWRGFNHIHHTWQHFENINLVKRTHIENASKGLGDGVHHFKNYILRGGREATKFRQSMDDIEQAMAAYQAAGELNQQEKDILGNIALAVSSYRTAITRSEELKNEGMGATEIDASVKGADKPLSHSLRLLMDMNIAGVTDASGQFSSTIARANKQIKVALAIAVVIAMLIAWKMTRSITRPLNQALNMSHQIANGEFLPHAPPARHDETGRLLHEMHRMQSTIQRIVQALNEMSAQHSAGLIDYRIDSQQFNGAYQHLTEGINQMVEEHIVAQAKSLQVVTAFGQGDFNRPLEAFPGQRSYINQSIEQVRQNFKRLMEDVNTLSHAAALGQLATRADIARHHGEFKQIVAGFNQTLDAVVEPLQTTARYLDEMAAGHIPTLIEEHFVGDFNLMQTSLQHCAAAIHQLIADVHHLASDAQQGKLDTRVNIDAHAGDFRQIIQGINQTLDAVVSPLHVAADCVKRIAAGDIPNPIQNEYHGDFEVLIDNLNTCIDAVNRLVDDTRQIAGEAQQGQLYSLVDVTTHTGDFREVLQGSQEILQRMIAPIQTVKIAAETIHVAAAEIEKGNNDLSRRTETQANALQETSANLETLTSHIRQTAEHAQQANQQASQANQMALQGGKAFSALTATMQAINATSAQIEQITGVIDSIAFQTNILALNAAVEAARAGEEGRGFAVVAGEVRNLAKRSAASAKEIKELIAASVTQTSASAKQVSLAGQTMQEIVGAVQQVSQSIQAISEASNQQSSGLEQIYESMTSIDETTQQNAALVEEAAAAAESLLEQVDTLVTSVNQFKIREQMQERGRQEHLRLIA